ncbi:MAG: secretin N-terminal domain-containing protein, partial [Candidatus Aerophobetes bacterium]|nr:secretin N-terminal domain-containing protein [Candidatus Aerophobetes bacterium]
MMSIMKVWIFLGLWIGIITLSSPCLGSLYYSDKISPQNSEISLDFSNTDLRDVLHTISLKTGLNIIIGPQVEGKVTASFPRPTPVLKALQIILKLNGCEYRREDDVIKVTKVRISLLTRSFQIKYALGTELVSSIKPLLSDKGTLNLDEETNTLIVTDTQKNLTGIKDAILKLDEPARQMQTRNFSLRFIQAKKAASILKSHLSKAGKIEIDPSANSLLVRDVAYKMKEIPSFLSSLDVFKGTLKVFPLKFALVDEVAELLSAYLSAEGELNVNKEKNELIVIDSPYNLKKIEDFISSIDNPQKQMREEDFQIKYAQLEKVKSSIEEELSSYGK